MPSAGSTCKSIAHAAVGRKSVGECLHVLDGGIFHFSAAACCRRRTGESSAKRVESANSLFWELSNTINEGLVQQNSFSEESSPLR